MSFARKACLLTVLLLEADVAFGAYQSAGCSDEGCGIPCYLRPAEDDCHYTDHGDSPCDDGGGDDLLQQLWLLNNTLVRLEDKLIQKGIIPAGGYCHPLPNIEHGGVIYSDLLISPGVIGTYVCEDNYSLHGHGKYECAVDAVWIGNTTHENPTCEESLVLCEPLVNIPNGHVSYQIIDSTKITPGDVVTYSCDEPYKLNGASYRVCIKNGTWTEEEPKCVAPNTEPSARTANAEDQVRKAVGSTVGAALIVAIVLVAIIIGVIYVVRRRKSTSRQGYSQMNEDEPDGSQILDKEEVRQKRSTEEPEMEPVHVETLQSN